MVDTWPTMRRLLCAGAGALLCSFPAAALGQTTVLEGRVTDQQGAVLAGVVVSVVGSALADGRQVATDGTGTYRVSSLPPGIYAIRFALSGFLEEQRADVALEAGEVLRLDAVLTLAPFSDEVEVVDVAPVLGAGVAENRVPAVVSVIDDSDLFDQMTVSLADTLNELAGAVTIEGATTNPYQPTVRFRGFTASPLLGLPQGIAVYQNGVRINEPFGDTVQFDLVPQFAVDRVQLSAGAEPTYGLNALGGALALRLKNGFDHPGIAGEFSGGSFDRLSGTVQGGTQRGAWGVYAGASRFDEGGYRQESASEVTQAVVDLGYRAGRADGGISFTYAETSLNGNGPLPAELYEVDRRAVYTFPDTTRNRLAFGQGRFTVAVSPVWSLQLAGYYRDLDQRTLNGDEAEFTVCDDDLLPPGAPTATLCAGGDDDERGGFEGSDDAAEADPLVDAVTGRFIVEDDARGDAAFNRTSTRSAGYGATVQVTAATEVGGRPSVFVAGLATDVAAVGFISNREVGTLTSDRTVDGSGLFAGIFGEAPDDLFNTDIDADNRAVGLYFSDTLSLGDRTHLTLSGRFNAVEIDIADNLGTSLSGRHLFQRLNPGVGLVQQVAGFGSVFGRYSESARAPTAAELSCADPAEPCRVPNAFVSDPPLEQAVARSFEGGARGVLVGALGTVDWSVAAYRTAIRDDILFVASPDLVGAGYFQNAGSTRRLGLDVDVRGQMDRLEWFASFGLTRATFESELELPSSREVNDAANDDGNVEVQPGDRLPGIPQHSLKAGVAMAATSAWDVAVDVIAASSRRFAGDEGNDQDPLDGFGVVNLRTTFRVSDQVELFGRLDNLFDREYATFGVLAEVDIELAEVPDVQSPRFIGPGPPRSAFAGLRVRY